MPRIAKEPGAHRDAPVYVRTRIAVAETDVARPPHPEVVGMVPPPPRKIGQSSPRVVVDGVGPVIVEIGEFRMIVLDETVADVYVPS